MEWYKRNPFFYTVLAILIALAVGGLWLLNGERNMLAELTSEYNQKNRILDSLLSRRPSPTNANVEVLELNYATLYQEYKRALGALKLDSYEKELFFGPLPATHNDAFFALARYVEDTRILAASKGIAIPEGYRFGFQEYANEGPRQDDIENRHHQMKIMRVLVQWLFDSGIRELLGIQRGQESGTGIARRFNDADTEFATDLFLVDGGSSERMDGSIGAESFRVAFKGQSASLRNFLNRITNSSLPFVVSSIQARLANERGGARRDAMPDNPFFQETPDEALEASRVPIISENESLFVVTLEFLELKDEFADPVAFAGSDGGNDV